MYHKMISAFTNKLDERSARANKVMQRFDGKTKGKKARENSTQCDMADDRRRVAYILCIGGKALEHNRMYVYGIIQ